MLIFSYADLFLCSSHPLQFSSYAVHQSASLCKAGEADFKDVLIRFNCSLIK